MVTMGEISAFVYVCVYAFLCLCLCGGGMRVCMCLCAPPMAEPLKRLRNSGRRVVAVVVHARVRVCEYVSKVCILRDVRGISLG